MPDLCGVGIGARLEQGLRGHDHPRRAVPALEGEAIDERFLQRMELRAVGETLDGLDRLAISLDRERRARAHRSTVEEHRTRAADLRVAAELRADEPEPADELDEQRLILDLELAVDPVQAKSNLALPHLRRLRQE